MILKLTAKQLATGNFATNCNFAANHSFDDFKEEITHDHKKIIYMEKIDSHDLTPMIS